MDIRIYTDYTDIIKGIPNNILTILMLILKSLTSMNKKYYIAVAIIALIITTAGTSLIVSASEVDSDKFEGKRIHKFELNHEEVRAAIENSDYEAFAELTVGTPLGDRVTSDNFDQFVEAHNLMKEGDFEGAKAIREELGFPVKPNGKHKMKHSTLKLRTPGGNGQKGEIKAVIIEAIEAGDYSAWKEAIGDKPITEQISEDDFGQFVEMHNLIKAGEREGAKAIADELGIKKKIPSTPLRTFGGDKKGFRACPLNK